MSRVLITLELARALGLRRHGRHSRLGTTYARWFMSQPKPQVRKPARLLRWLSVGRGSTRSNSQPPTQIAQQSSTSNAGSRLIVSGIFIGQRPTSLRLSSAASAAAIKSP